MTVLRPQSVKETLVLVLPMILTMAILIVVIPVGTPYKMVFITPVSYLVGYVTFKAYKRRKQ